MRSIALTTLLLASLAAGVAHGQSWSPAPAGDAAEPTVLPIWNNTSGRMEGLLLVDGMHERSSALDRVIGPAQRRSDINLARLRTAQGTRIDLSAGLEHRPGLALLCDSGTSSLLSSFGALSENCLLADLGASDPLNAFNPTLGGGIGLQRGAARLQFDAGMTRADLGVGDGGQPWWAQSGMGLLGPSLYGPSRFEQDELQLTGSYAFGSNGWVSLGGSMARARLIPAGEALSGPLDWIGSELSFGVGVGNFSGEITGRNIDLPGSQPSWSGLDIGVSWRTPWQGKLTLGTQNVISSGGLPLLGENDGADDGQRTPYVRYQQDL